MPRFPHSALASGDVRVRYQRADCVDADTLSAAVAVLGDEERARYARFHFERDRREFAIAHALLRRTLSACADRLPLDWAFEDDANGKPVLDGRDGTRLSFNLSHSHGLVACAVALDAKVGVDVESVTRTTDWRSIAPRHFSADEVAQIDRLPVPERPARFFELWTLKEAFAKALGVGLSQSLGATTFDLPDTGAMDCRLPPHVDAGSWTFALYQPSTDHRLAVAVSDGSSREWRIDVRGEGDNAGRSEPLRTRALAGHARRQPDQSGL